MLEITGADDDGELLARPLNWDSNEEPPLIYVAPPKEGARSDRATACWRGWKNMAEAYEARIIRRLDSETPARLILGVLREAPHGGSRLVPMDKKARGEYALDKADLGGAKNNELVASEPQRAASPAFRGCRWSSASAAWIPPHHQPDRHSRPWHSHRISAKR